MDSMEDEGEWVQYQPLCNVFSCHGGWVSGWVRVSAVSCSVIHSLCLQCGCVSGWVRVSAVSAFCSDQSHLTSLHCQLSLHWSISV